MADEELLTDKQLRELMSLASSTYSIENAAKTLSYCQEEEERARGIYVIAQTSAANAKRVLEQLQARMTDAMARLQKEFVRRHELALALAEQEQDPDFNSRARGEPEI